MKNIKTVLIKKKRPPLKMFLKSGIMLSSFKTQTQSATNFTLSAISQVASAPLKNHATYVTTSESTLVLSHSNATSAIKDSPRVVIFQGT